MSVTVYHTGHWHSHDVCRAVVTGTGFRIRPSKAGADERDTAIFYGITRRNDKIRDRCQRYGQDWYLIDNGYMRPGYLSGYYRVTKNALLHSGYGEPDFDRFAELRIRLQPWQRTERNITIFVPPPIYGKYWGLDTDAWARNVKSQIRGKTDRPIVLSYKPEIDSRRPPHQPPLSEQLADAWAVIVHDSNVAIDALIAGVPVFVTGETPAKRCARTDLSEIENPLYPDDREELLAVLAANQWTLDEFRDGTMWRHFCGS